MFKALTFFRFPPSLDWSGLEDLLHPLKPVGPLELASRGFVSPYGDDRLAVMLGNAILLTIGGEDKILPAAAVRAEQAKRIKAMEKTEGRMPGGRTRKRILEDVIHEFLPRAFIKPSRLDVMLFPDIGLIAVNTTSRKAAEEAVSEIRQAIGSFPALPLTCEKSIPGVLTEWIMGVDMPDSLWLGEEAWLESQDEATVKVQHHDLQCDEIAKHLEAGKRVTRLGLVLDDHLSFMLDDYLVVRKLKFLDGAIDELESTEHDDLIAELDARYHLVNGEIRRLFDVLNTAFDITGESDDLA